MNKTLNIGIGAGIFLLSLFAAAAVPAQSLTLADVSGNWRLVVDGGPPELRDAYLVIDDADGAGQASLFFGNTPDSTDNVPLYEGASVDGQTLKAYVYGWSEGVEMQASGDAFVGTLYYHDQAYPARAERLASKVTGVEVYRQIGWGDIHRGMEGDVGSWTEAPWHIDDLREAWNGAVSAANLPSVTLVIRGENLPLHLYALRRSESLDPALISFDGALIRDDGALQVTFHLSADTEPGHKTFLLNGEPIEWDLEFSGMPRPLVSALRALHRVNGKLVPLGEHEPVAYGSKIAFELEFGADRPEGEVVGNLAAPSLGTDTESLPLEPIAPGSRVFRTEDLIVLSPEIEGRLTPELASLIGNPVYADPGSSLVFSYEDRGAQVDILRQAHIDYVFAIDPQEGVSTEAGRPYMRYPFSKDSPGTGAAERILMVIGKNLPRDIGDVFELESYGQPIHYAPYRYQSQASDNFDNGRLFDRGWNKFAEIAAGYGPAPTRDDSEYMLVLATLEDGALPGYHEIYLNGAHAPWRLQYGDNAADMRFARDLGAGAFEGSGHLYFTERFAIEILPDVDVGAPAYDLVLRRYRMQDGAKPQAYGDPVRLSAKRVEGSDGRLVYRTPSLDLRPDKRTNRGRPPSPDVMQLAIEPGTVMTATLTQPELLMVRSVSSGVDAMAEIGVTPDDFGALWADALRRAGQCYGAIPDRDWRSLSLDQAESQLSINVLYLNDERNDVVDRLPIQFGHVAAAVLLRDHFVRLMQGARAHWQAVLSEPARQEEFLASLLSGRIDYDDPLYQTSITNPAGKPTALIEALLPADTLKDRYSLDDTGLVEWRTAQLAVALEQVIASIDKTIDYANGLGDCKGEDLVKLTGVSFDAVIADLEPRMVRLAEFENPRRLEWEPDLAARKWLHQVGSLATSIRDIESRHDLYIHVGLAAVALASGVGAPLLFAETNALGFVAAEMVSVGADVATAGLDYSSNMERRALISRALGASRVLGNDVAAFAEDYGVTDSELFISVLGAFGGVAASGLTVGPLVPDAAAQFSDLASGLVAGRVRRSTRALVEAIGAAGLGSVGPAGQTALVEAAGSAMAREAAFGSETLSEFDRLTVNMYETQVLSQGANSTEEVREAVASLLRPLRAEELAPTLAPGPLPAEFDDLGLALTRADEAAAAKIAENAAADLPPTRLEPPPDAANPASTGAAAGRAERVPEDLDPLARQLFDDLAAYGVAEDIAFDTAQLQSRPAYVLDGFLEGGDAAENWEAVRAGTAWLRDAPVQEALAVTGQSIEEFADSLDRWLRDVWNFPNAGERAILIDTYLGDLTPQRFSDRWAEFFDDPRTVQMALDTGREVRAGFGELVAGQTPGTGGLPRTLILDEGVPVNPSAIVDPSAPPVGGSAVTRVEGGAAPAAEGAPVNPSRIVDPDAPPAGGSAVTRIEDATLPPDPAATLPPVSGGAPGVPDGGSVVGPAFPGRANIEPNGELNFVTQDGQAVSLRLGERLGEPGATTSAFAKAGESGRIYRVSQMNTGAAVHEVNGRGLLDGLGDLSEGPLGVAGVHNRWTVSRAADGGQYIVEEVDRVPHTAAEILEARGELTQGQRLAKDRAERFLNRHGIAWTDNSMRNVGLAPIDEASDRWRVVVFDTGGFYPAVGDTPFQRWRNAREIQMAINDSRLRPDYARRIASELIDSSQYPRSAFSYLPDSESYILAPLATGPGRAGYGSVGQLRRYGELGRLAGLDAPDIDALYEAYYGRRVLSPPPPP